MDRNTIIGFSLIFLILAGYYWYTAPTPEQLEQMKKTQDSLTLVETKRNDSLKVEDQLAAKSSPEKISAAGSQDSVQQDHVFQDTNYILANKHLSLTISKTMVLIYSFAY
jgi:YidC/Oxa1 family membrane protein insertase